MTEPHYILTAKYRVVTPMFLSGADQNHAELRLPSFKGALRFWWRALAAGRFANDLQNLRNAEDSLFGSTRTGVSKVQMRLVSCETVRTAQCGDVLHDAQKVVGEGARYLGYGVMEAFASRKKNTQAGQLLRPCMQAQFRFVVGFRCRGLKNDELTLLQQAIKALGLLGGLGSKSRKGYGSIVLEELSLNDESQWSNPQTIKALAEAIKDLYSTQGNGRLPLYTALSGRSRHVIMKGDEDSCLALLNLVGREMMRYRSWGHNGKVFGEDSERNFKDDHDLMKQNPDERRTHPERIAFGLPHNYGKDKSDQIPPAKAKEEEGPNRRASPLLIHIHKCDNQTLAILSFFPAVFLPGGNKAEINVGGKVVPVTPDPKIWQPVEALLDRFASGQGRKESFSESLEVRP